MKKRGFWKKLLLVLAVLLVLVVVTAAVVWFTLPDISTLAKTNPRTTAIIEFRRDEAKEADKPFHPRWYWCRLGRISPLLVQSVLVAEDDKFYTHEGFDWEAVQKALEKNFEKKRFAVGGSTITQQLAKNLYLSPRRNLFRKFREAMLAYKLERELSKARILELYLNVIEWGDGIFGIEAASRAVYQKSAAALTASEAIRLASILPNPHRFSARSDDNRRMNRKRQNMAQRLLQRRVIDAALCQALRREFGGK